MEYSYSLDEVRAWLNNLAGGTLDLEIDNQAAASAALGYLKYLEEPEPEPAPEPAALPPGYLSPNFTLDELTHSDTATANGIDNTPGPDEEANLSALAAVLEQVRAICLDYSVTISSGYRCPELNALVGGASNSAHLYGLAADFTIPEFGDPTAVCKNIEPHLGALGIDQLIDESGGGARWVHLGLPAVGAPPRCQCLTINASGTCEGFA